MFGYLRKSGVNLARDVATTSAYAVDRCAWQPTESLGRDGLADAAGRGAGRGAVAFGQYRFQRSADFGEFFGLVDLIVRRAYCRGSVPVLLN